MLFDQYRYLAQDDLAVEFALWLHDSIYRTHKQPRGLTSNEALSAVCADDFLALSKVSIMRLREDVRGLVMATTHQPGTANTDDEKLIADIDWSLIGCSWEDFEQNGRDIRYEYALISDEEFRDGREKFFVAALRRQSQFYLKEFRDQYEVQAVSNLQRALDELRGIMH
jgi:predicted metal-dependent HD superfamily phosphohydrolase